MNTIIPNENDNINFISYDLATGRILSQISCPAYAYTANARPIVGVEYLQTSVLNCNSVYVLDGAIVERPRLNSKDGVLQIKADGIDSISFDKIPVGSTVTLDDQLYEINDGVFVFTTEKQGRYVLEFDAFPFLDEIIEIEAI